MEFWDTFTVTHKLSYISHKRNTPKISEAGSRDGRISPSVVQFALYFYAACQAVLNVYECSGWASENNTPERDGAWQAGAQWVSQSAPANNQSYFQRSAPTDTRHSCPPRLLLVPTINRHQPLMSRTYNGRPACFFLFAVSGTGSYNSTIVLLLLIADSIQYNSIFCYCSQTATKDKLKKLPCRTAIYTTGHKESVRRPVGQHSTTERFMWLLLAPGTLFPLR